MKMSDLFKFLKRKWFHNNMNYQLQLYAMSIMALGGRYMTHSHPSHFFPEKGPPVFTG
jgi:hypothetical protein